MKKTLLSLIFLSLFSFVISAETLHLSYFNKNEFISDINGALKSESAEALIQAATIYLTKMHEANVPNCFACSLYLIQVTDKAAPEIQLAAADLAVKFSNDLPEAHHHYLSRLVHLTPFHVDKISVQLVAAVRTSLHFIFSDSTNFLVVKSVSKICLIFFALFILVMMLKYPGIIIHKYKHLVGFSRFYAVAFIITFSFAAWIVSADFHNLIFIVIPLLIFFGDLGTRSEKAALHIAVTVFMLCEAFSLLTEKDMNPRYDQDVAYNHLLAVISPETLPGDNIDMSQPGAYMAKGFLFLYNHNFSRAAFNFKKELAAAEVPEIRNMLMNALGVALASNGKHGEAIPYLRDTYAKTGDNKIGYNLSKILYEDGYVQESTALEQKILSSDSLEIFPYPYLYYADFAGIWKYLCYGNSGYGSKNKTLCVLYIVFSLFFYLVMILIKIGYLRSLRITRCPECGSILCSKCTPGGSDVCAVCKLMKADYTLFKRGEREVYEFRRESFFKRRSLFMNIITFVLPGGGLIFVDRIAEGSFYLAFPLLITFIYYFNSMGLVVDSSNVTVTKIAIISIDLIFYFVSIIRALFAARKN